MATYNADQIASYISNNLGFKAVADGAYPVGNGTFTNNYCVIVRGMGYGKTLTLPQYESDGVTPWVISGEVVFKSHYYLPLPVTQSGSNVGVTSNYANKITASLVENGNLSKWTTLGAVQLPTGFVTEFSQGGYNNLKTKDGTNASITSSASGNRAQMLFSFDVIRAITDALGASIWGTASTLAQKIAIASTLITKITYNWTGFGSSVGGSSASVSSWDTGAWQSATVSTASTATLVSRSVNTGIASKIDANGFVHILAYTTNTGDGVTSSVLNTDEAEVVLQLTKG